MIRGLLDGKIKFYVSPLPSYVDDEVREAVEHDIQLFDNMGNENIRFQRVYDENDSDLSINWVKNYGTHGREIGEAIFRAHIKIGLGKDNCFGEWKPFDNVTVQKILWHELGHALGFGHSEKEDNVMFWQTHTRFIEDYSDELLLAEGYYRQIGFCNGGTMFYDVESEDKTNGFELYVVPKGVKLQDFVDGTARYYPDCSKTDLMIKFAEYCNVAAGDSIVIYNPLDSASDTASKINIKIIDYNESPAVDLGWDMDAMEYDFDAIEELLKYR